MYSAAMEVMESLATTEPAATEDGSTSRVVFFCVHAVGGRRNGPTERERPTSPQNSEECATTSVRP